MVKTFLMALAIAFIIEGLVPALFPNKWRAYVAKLAQEPVNQIRMVGFIITIIGLVMLWWFSTL